MHQRFDSHGKGKQLVILYMHIHGICVLYCAYYLIKRQSVFRVGIHFIHDSIGKLLKSVGRER